jgi:hypothetical protein
MKGDSEKIVSIGGWGAAGMMRNFFCCYKSLAIAAFKAPQLRIRLHVKPSSVIITVNNILPILIAS